MKVNSNYAEIDYKAENLKIKQRCEESETENKRLNELIKPTALFKIKSKTKKII
jgi:hypothetical protein